MGKVSDKVRPNAEAAPWVIDEIKKLEAENEQLRKERQAFKDVAEFQKAENAKLNSTLEDILFHVEEAMRNEVQPYEVEMAAKRARAALGESE